MTKVHTTERTRKPPRHTRMIRTRGGGEFNTTTTNTMMATMMATRDVQQLHKLKKHITCLIFFNSRQAAEAAGRHANPWNIGMIFMD